MPLIVSYPARRGRILDFGPSSLFPIDRIPVPSGFGAGLRIRVLWPAVPAAKAAVMEILRYFSILITS